MTEQNLTYRLFNAPLIAEVDLTVSSEVPRPPTLFEKIGRALSPLIGQLKVEEEHRHAQVRNSIA